MTRWNRRALSLAALLALAPARTAHAQAPRCVTADVERELSLCELGARTAAARSVGSAPPSHLPAATAGGAAPASADVATPGLSADRAPPAAGLRSIELLDREVQTLERIVSRLDPADPRGADYLFRLAESHFERERHFTVVARALDEPLFEARARGDTARVSTLERDQHAAEAEAQRAREGSIRAYARLLEDHPSFARADEVLFALASSLEQLDQHERARQVYLRLVREHPESRFVPHAWLAFGEHDFSEGDMAAARQFYERVLETPAAHNPVFGFALYKLAWVAYNLEDYRGALERFSRVLEHARTVPAEDPHGAALARQARRELVLPYAHVGQPARALAFFRRLAASDDEALEMLESLGALYVDTGQWPEAIATHHALMSAAPRSDHLCVWQSRVTSAVIASRPKPEQVTEIERLLDVARAFASTSHPERDVRACRIMAAQTTYETAVAWHRESVGTDAQPGTRDRRTMSLALRLYGLADAIEDLATLEFPEIAREDWPTPARVAYARAELAYASEDWSACGPAFDRVVTLEPSGALAEDAAYAAVLCYDRVYQREYEPSETARGATASASTSTTAPSLAARPLTDLEQHMLAAFQRFACVAPESADLPQVQYRRARVYYVANHFDEAATLFRRVAFEHPDHELAPFAANLYLDSLNGLLSRDGRRACRDELAQALAPLHETQCATPARAAENDTLCDVVAGLRCELDRQEAEALGSRGRHREAANAYVAIFRAHPECGRLDEVLFDAGIHFEAARLLGRAIRVRQVLVDRFPESPLVRPTLHRIGANHHALALYGQAASYYEQYARRFPDDDGSACAPAERETESCPRAFAALENAVFFRLGLGEEERALEDARLYERSYRRSRPRETAQVVFSLGLIHERRGDWARAYAHYHAFLRDYGRTALPHETVRAHVQLGRAQWEQGRHEEAMPHFRAAEAAWSRASAAWSSAPASDDEAVLRARAQEAASEALFYLGEESFAAFVALRFPRFTGPATLTRVSHWSRESLGPWLVRKLEALHAAERAYARIEPLGIPEWRIAGAARVGEMYRSVVDDVRGAPVPDEIANDPELLALYDDSVEALLNGSSPGPDGSWDTADDVRCPDPTAGAPLSSDASEGVALPSACRAAPIAQALGAFEHCLGLATRVRWFNTWSTRCESALNEMARARYPLAAELRGTASFSPERLAEPGAASADVAEETASEPEPLPTS